MTYEWSFSCEFLVQVSWTENLGHLSWALRSMIAACRRSKQAHFSGFGLLAYLTDNEGNKFWDDYVSQYIVSAICADSVLKTAASSSCALSVIIRPAAATVPRLIWATAATATIQTQSHAVSLQSSQWPTSGATAADTTWNDPLDTTTADDQEQCQVLHWQPYWAIY